MSDWISVEEAAELSGYSEEQLRRLIREKQVTADKKGGRWWVDQKSLLSYLKASKQSPDKRRGPKSRNSEAKDSSAHETRLSQPC
jgi:excisionase family DNA binding protein